MRNPIPAARRAGRRGARRLRRILLSLRRHEVSLTFFAEQGGPLARQAGALAGDIGCILTDHLGPALDALEKALANEGPFPEPEER